MSENTFSSNQNEELLWELALRLATFPGDPRVKNPQLLFLLLKRPEVENQYFLHVRADSSRTGRSFLSVASMQFG